MKTARWLPLWAYLLLVAAGCQSLGAVSKEMTDYAVSQGAITQEQAQSINRAATATGKAFEQITPEQEYYIGRAVAATILAQYKPYDDQKANRYLNVLGQTLAAASDKPETFAGYHFLILDTEEINAFAAPGGFILVSRGLLRCCKNEDAVAAVLAHEIGHVQYGHGVQAIKKSRLTAALTILAAEGARNLGSRELAELTDNFEGAVSDVTATLVNAGYSRKSESEADAAAVTILSRVGYSPAGLKEMLQEMDKRLKPGGPGFAKTHPDPKDRIADIEPLLAGASAPTPQPAARLSRFRSSLEGV